MTPEPTTPPPRSRWRRLRLGRWLLVAVLAVLGYGAWREYDFRAAIKEAEALGWEWEYADPFEAIRKDWKTAFRKATWTDGERYLGIENSKDLERHARLLRRLAPKSLQLEGALENRSISALKDLSSLQELHLFDCDVLTSVDALQGLPALHTLGLARCTDLTNINALKGLPTLRWLDLSGCIELTNVDALRGLSGLQVLYLTGCTGLTNVDGLGALPKLQRLYLGGCTRLANVSAFKGLSGLQELYLFHCIQLANVDALNGLSALQMLDLSGCKNIPEAEIEALKAVLPTTEIIAPNTP